MTTEAKTVQAISGYLPDLRSVLGAERDVAVRVRALMAGRGEMEEALAVLWRAGPRPRERVETELTFV